MALRDRVIQGIGGQATTSSNGDLRFDSRLCVTGVGDLV